MKKVICSILLASLPFLYSCDFNAAPKAKAQMQQLAQQSDQAQIAPSALEKYADIYSSMYEKLKSGDKLRIFVQGNHGKALYNGNVEWISEMGKVDKTSCTGKPEELYGGQISKRFVEKLRNNPFIEVVMFDDYKGFIEGKSDSWRDIDYLAGAKATLENQCVLYVEGHANKFDGKRTGHLVLYGFYDFSGLGEKIAEINKEMLCSNNLNPDSFGNGVVADKRYGFANIPSVIFESEFMDSPQGEKRLSNPEFQELYAETQYQSVIKAVKEAFGLDISGDAVRKTADYERFKDLQVIMKDSLEAQNELAKNNKGAALAIYQRISDYSREKGFKYQADLANKMIELIDNGKTGVFEAFDIDKIRYDLPSKEMALVGATSLVTNDKVRFSALEK